MIPVVAAVLLALQAPPDSIVRVNGFVVMDSAVARLVLTYPLMWGGARVATMTLPGDGKRWSRYSDRYVEAEGRPVAEGLREPRVKEVSPPGMVSRFIEPSVTQRAAVTLAVIPQRIARQDAAGKPTGVQAVAYYTLANHGETQLLFRFTTAEILCIGVTRQGETEALWRDAWRPRARSELGLRVQLGAVVRYIVPIPAQATPEPGRYLARVSLCGVTDYEMTTEFEVVG